MDQLTVDLNQKIDRLTEQVSYLTVQSQIAERQRENREDLLRDLAPIANQVFHLTIEQLEEIQDYIDLGDLLRLLKRLMRNGRNLEKMLDQLESISDLAETIGPLSDEAFLKVVEIMTHLEQKGYFKAAQNGMKILDGVVSSYSEKDIQMDSSLLGLMRQMGDPDVRRAIAHSLYLLKAIGSQLENKS
jgi:uncharacterized protein YjgD (DUF1641 family)